MRENILTATRLANRCYLQDVLRRSAPERHDGITAQFERHMATITDYCMDGYAGVGSLTTEFIRGLHKMLFPEGYTYRQEVDGKLLVLVPGQYRGGQGAADSQLQPGTVVVFAPPEEVSTAMESATARLNAALSAANSAKAKRDAVLWFIFDFSVIHPFGDANGRVMCMICDLLLIKEGLPPIHFCAIKEQHREDLYRAGDLAQRNRDLTPLYEVIERYHPQALGLVGHAMPNEMKIQAIMNEHLQQLEALSRHPSLKVSHEQRPVIVGNILHHLMYPYFLQRTPEMREKFDNQQYQVFMRALADYCLREYVENPEPRLTIEFIKGLHRQFYGNAASVPVKAVDGTMTAMVPGEFKTGPVYVRQDGEWVATPAPENVLCDMALLLDRLHDEGVPLFHRYIQFMFDLTLIHPFPDSNGKVVLVLADLFLLKQGLHPPYFAKYLCSNKQELHARAEQYRAECSIDPQRHIAGLYPVVLSLYEECGLGSDTLRGQSLQNNILDSGGN